MPLMGSAPIRVMVVHGHQRVCDALAVCLGFERDIEVVGTAFTCGIALDMAAALRPDLVLIGRSTPWSGGIDAAHRLVNNRPELLVVILSGTAGPDLAAEAIESGASGYLPLDASPSEIATTVRRLIHS